MKLRGHCIKLASLTPSNVFT